jgi:hypothetical protein
LGSRPVPWHPSAESYNLSITSLHCRLSCGVSQGRSPKRLSSRLALSALVQQKTPRRGGGALSGVTTGRRDMYLYICGSVGGRWALMCRGRSSWETMGAIEAALNPTRKFGAAFIVNLPCIL